MDVVAGAVNRYSIRAQYTGTRSAAGPRLLVNLKMLEIGCESRKDSSPIPYWIKCRDVGPRVGPFQPGLRDLDFLRLREITKVRKKFA